MKRSAKMARRQIQYLERLSQPLELTSVQQMEKLEKPAVNRQKGRALWFDRQLDWLWSL